MWLGEGFLGGRREWVGGWTLEDVVGFGECVTLLRAHGAWCATQSNRAVEHRARQAGRGGRVVLLALTWHTVFVSLKTGGYSMCSTWKEWPCRCTCSRGRGGEMAGRRIVQVSAVRQVQRTTLEH